MEAFIKYKRIHTTILEDGDDVQIFFDDLITNGWNIIYYNESPRSIANFNTKGNYNATQPYLSYLDITVVVGKKQNVLL
jgi:hypothetical protein